MSIPKLKNAVPRSSPKKESAPGFDDGKMGQWSTVPGGGGLSGQEREVSQSTSWEQLLLLRHHFQMSKPNQTGQKPSPNGGGLPDLVPRYDNRLLSGVPEGGDKNKQRPSMPNERTSANNSDSVSRVLHQITGPHRIVLKNPLPFFEISLVT